jgi:hypothetical protein
MPGVKLDAFVATDAFAKLDEGLQALYEEDKDAGGYVLAVNDLPFKSKLNEFKNNNRQLFESQQKIEKQRKELETKLEKFKDIDPEKYEKVLHQLEEVEKLEDAELIKAGKIDEVVSKRTVAMVNDHKNQLGAKDGIIQKMSDERNQLRTRLGSLVIDTSVQSAVNKIGLVRPGAIADVLSRARGVFSIDEQGNMVPRDTKGEIRFGKDSNPLTVEEWSASLLTEAPHLFEGGNGGGASGNRTTTRTDTKTVDRNDPIAMGKNLVGIASGKVTAA